MENAEGDSNFISTMKRRTSTLRVCIFHVFFDFILPIRGAQTMRLDRAQLSRVFWPKMIQNQESSRVSLRVNVLDKFIS